MADIDYYEVLGVEKPAEGDTGEKEDETADRPDETEEEGAKEGEAAESPVDDDDDAEDDSDDGEQSDEDNARYAAIRRKAEAEAAEKAARERDRAIADMGFKDEQGNDITTLDELNAWRRREGQRRDDEAYEEDIERYLDLGMSEDEAREIAELKKSSGRLKELEAKLNAEADRQREAAFNARVAEELSMIQEFDPSIKSVADLPNMDNFEEFKAFVEGGDNYITAYMRSHRGKTPAAVSRDSGKGHLRSTSTRGGSGKTIPESVYAEYLLFNPDATRKEIREHYLRNHRD